MNLQSKLTEARTDSKDGPTVLVVGDNHVASTVALGLAGDTEVRVTTDDRCVATHADDLPVCLATDSSPDDVELDRSGETSVVYGDFPDADTLRAAGAEAADVAVVAMQSDSGSLLATQLLRTEFDTTDVVTVVEDPRSEETFRDVAPQTVCVADLVASTVESTLDEHSSGIQYG